MRRATAIGVVLGAIFATRPASGGAPVAWAVDDLTRVRPGELDRPEKDGARNAVWSPARGLRLHALAGETVAWQVVVESGDEPLDGVRVDLAPLASDEGRTLGAAQAKGGGIARFVEHAIPIAGRTRARGDGSAETLAWAGPASRPSDAAIGDAVPDALVPVEHAPAWAPYPLRIPARSSRVVWFDLTIPEEAAAGAYRGSITIAAGARRIGTVPVRVDVKSALLPFAAARTMIFYDPAELRGRIGSELAEAQLWRTLRAHHLSPLLSADDAADVERLRPALDGSAFTRAAGYVGPAADLGADVLGIGTYGSLGEPGAASLEKLEGIVHALASVRDLRADVFLYAIDERCDSDRAARWRERIAASPDPLVRAVRVGETCDRRPEKRAIDVAMVSSFGFDAAAARRARAAGKRLWVYNGRRPRSGAMMLDVPATDLCANGWIAAALPVDRWFYWESTFWNDDNRGGRGPVDPFAVAESFHNADGDAVLGDGLLVYPGRQLAYPAHSLGVDGVVPSIRLKSLRRGVQDAGYVALVASRDPVRAATLVRGVVPRALDEVPGDDLAPSWSERGAAFVEARRALWEAVGSAERLAPAEADAALASVARVRTEARAARTRVRVGAPMVTALALTTALAGLAWLRTHRAAGAPPVPRAPRRPHRRSRERHGGGVPPRDPLPGT